MGFRQQLGKTPSDFLKDMTSAKQESGALSALRKKLEVLVTEATVPIKGKDQGYDDWCIFGIGTKIASGLVYGGSSGWSFPSTAVTTLQKDTPMEVVGLATGTTFYKVNWGSSIGYFTNKEAKECMKAADFEKNAVFLSSDAVDLFWKKNKLGETLTPAEAYDILNDKDRLSLVVKAIVSGFLKPLINGQEDASTMNGAQAQAYFKKWGVSV